MLKNRKVLMTLVAVLTIIAASMFSAWAASKSDDEETIRNATSVTVLLISALAMSGAVFLILEMSHPMTGFIRVAPTPMLKAIELLEAKKS